MSDTEQPRDAASGQFVSEETFGIKGVEIDQGYIPRPDPEPAPVVGRPNLDSDDVVGSDDESLRELSRRKYGDAPNDDVIERKLIMLDTGEPAPENWAQTVEQAHNDLTNVHQWERDIWEAEQNQKVADKVDKARAERIKGDAKLAEGYGLDVNEVEANAQALEATATSDKEAASAEEPTVEGLAPEVEQALKHPQVRQAIEQELAQVDAAKQGYAQALTTAQQYAQASLMDTLPELANVPQELWVEAIGVINQSDPQRVQRAMAILQRGAEVEAAQAQLRQHQAAEQRQQFETYAKAEDARFEQMIEKAQLSKTERETIGQEVLAYAGEMGVDAKTLVNLMQTNPIVRHSAFQRMMVDAARYRMVKAAPAKAVAKPVLAVQKPGVAQPRGAAEARSIHALSAKLSSSGSVEDAYALYQAKQKSRR
ncbi:hypothetical protein [Bradyrhizobium sp. 164]|uniref:hypothetical protein n=1 Tax=Bradyrhizobium sp. 164 TaxID=2782637 RepID=UPI001FFAA90C|nr:hypothetical protein [Bradyrhizobium sp. 164]MCK1595483.1 hypothetical protein [Bradyrhizobium sp. 164]